MTLMVLAAIDPVEDLHYDRDVRAHVVLPRPIDVHVAEADVVEPVAIVLGDAGGERMKDFAESLQWHTRHFRDIEFFIETKPSTMASICCRNSRPVR